MHKMVAAVRALIVAIAVTALMPVSGALSADALPPLPPNLSALAKPVAMPEFSFANLNGGTLQSSDMKGKVVIVRFWATW